MDILKFFKNDEPTYVLPFKEYTDISKQDKLKQQRKEAVRRYREKHTYNIVCKNISDFKHKLNHT